MRDPGRRPPSRLSPACPPTARPSQRARSRSSSAAQARPPTSHRWSDSLKGRDGRSASSTPAGAEFINKAELESLTGYPVRTEFRKPGDPEPSWPLADAIVVAPATINMVCKWGAGIADDLALGILFECMGIDLPIVVAPNVNSALARYPAFQRSVKQLREWGSRCSTSAQRHRRFGWRAGSGSWRRCPCDGVNIRESTHVALSTLDVMLSPLWWVTSC
jgi:hypothetical protein